jgi:hypothetical protein
MTCQVRIQRLLTKANLGYLNTRISVLFGADIIEIGDA